MNTQENNKTIAQVIKTQQNNKMIAEFMGARPIVFSDGTKGHTFWNDDFDGEGRYGAFPDGATNYFDYDKGYNTSWDWLMPVVDKINNILDDDDEFIYSVNIHPNMVTVYYENYDRIFIYNEHGSTMKEMLYLAVVEFINKYKNQ